MPDEKLVLTCPKCHHTAGGGVRMNHLCLNCGFAWTDVLPDAKPDDNVEPTDHGSAECELCGGVDRCVCPDECSSADNPTPRLVEAVEDIVVAIADTNMFMERIADALEKSMPTPCSHCGGVGRVKRRNDLGPGLIDSLCSACNGRGMTWGGDCECDKDEADRDFSAND